MKLWHTGVCFRSAGGMSTATPLHELRVLVG